MARVSLELGRLVDAGGTMLFPAFTIGYGWELWKSDGTAAGTTLLKSSGMTSFVGDPANKEAVALPGGPLFFILNDAEAGAELWKSDGTAGGTVRVADIVPGPLGSHPHQLTAAAGKLYFTADDGVHGDEPWVSDGTAAGTHMVADLRAGPGLLLSRQLQHRRRHAPLLRLRRRPRGGALADGRQDDGDADDPGHRARPPLLQP